MYLLIRSTDGYLSFACPYQPLTEPGHLFTLYPRLEKVAGLLSIMRRTRIINLNIFQLAVPAAATVTFISPSPLSPNTIHAIAPSNGWRMPCHWHPSQESSFATCESVKCLSGNLQVYVASGLSGGYV